MPTNSAAMAAILALPQRQQIRLPGQRFQSLPKTLPWQQMAANLGDPVQARSVVLLNEEKVKVVPGGDDDPRETVVGMARDMMKAKDMLDYFWEDSVTTAMYILNHTHT